MELLPLHPRIVHLPIALAVLMPLVATGAFVAWVRGLLPRRSFVLAVLFQAALVASAVAALRTGEVDEERAEAVVSHDLIHEHEEAGEVFTYAAGGVLALMLAAAAIGSERVGRGLGAASIVGTLVVFGLGYRVGELGGELVYVHGAASAYVRGADAPAPAEDEDAHEH